MPRYIDAEKMQSLLEEEIEGCGYPISENNPIAYGTTLGLKMALSYAKTLPTADIAPVVHAHWEVCEYNDKNGMKQAECSVCKSLFVYFKGHLQIGIMPYCPKCGAKMDEEVKK